MTGNLPKFQSLNFAALNIQIAATLQLMANAGPVLAEMAAAANRYYQEHPEDRFVDWSFHDSPSDDLQVQEFYPHSQNASDPSIYLN